MRLCCPPGHGCNAPGGREPCALALLRNAGGTPEATKALERWALAAGAREGERRFRRRAYQRARDRALIGLAMAGGSTADGPANERDGAIPESDRPARARPRRRPVPAFRRGGKFRRTASPS